MAPYWEIHVWIRLIKEVEEANRVELPSSVVYPLLYELEENGFIIGVGVRRGRKRIKYYSTTEEGVELLNRVKKLLETSVKEVLKDLMSQP